jgi:hypothetical protein
MLGRRTKGFSRIYAKIWQDIVAFKIVSGPLSMMLIVQSFDDNQCTVCRVDFHV